MTQWSRVSDLCRHVVDSDAGCQLPKELRRRAGAVLDAVRSVSVCNSRQIALHRLTPANHVLLLLSFPAFLDALRPLHVSHAITQKQSQYACLWTPCTSPQWDIFWSFVCVMMLRHCDQCCNRYTHKTVFK